MTLGHTPSVERARGGPKLSVTANGANVIPLRKPRPVSLLVLRINPFDPNFLIVTRPWRGDSAPPGCGRRASLSLGGSPATQLSHDFRRQGCRPDELQSALVEFPTRLHAQQHGDSTWKTLSESASTNPEQRAEEFRAWD